MDDLGAGGEHPVDVRPVRIQRLLDIDIGVGVGVVFEGVAGEGVLVPEDHVTVPSVRTRTRTRIRIRILSRG